MTDKQTYNNLLPTSNGPYCIITIQKHTLTIEKNCVPNNLSIDKATRAASNFTNADVGDERDVIRGQGAII